MRTIFVFIFTILSIFTNAQSADTLNLTLCRSRAKEKYPLLKQNQLIQEIVALKLKNLNTGYLPSLILNAQATYQSDVTSIPKISPMISFPEMSKDQYKAYLELQQVIWDGGTISALKQQEKAGQQVDQQNLEVELYKINETIDQLYFSMLIYQEQEQILKSLLSDLAQKEKKIKSGVENGVALQSNDDVLKVEMLKLDQQLFELHTNKDYTRKMMEIMLDTTISETTLWKNTDFNLQNTAFVLNRRELLLYDLQNSRLDVLRKSTNAKLMPRIAAFGQTGYGRPAFNMLSNDFDFFYIAGLKVSWNISSFYQYKNEKTIIGLQKNLISTQKETFEKNLMVKLQKDMSDISKYTALLNTDDEIIKLRSGISTSASAQLDQGIITATEYLTELTAETQAKLNKALHKIQLQQSLTNFLNDSGNLK
jgi:outer membrane protein TolC